MIPVAAKSSSSRPHTFGRSSNVWQYLDLVHDRSTPLSGDRALSAFSESTDNSDEEEEVPPHNRRLNEPRHVYLDSRSSSKDPVEGTKRNSRSHKGSLSGISSLPDLHHPRLREPQGSRKALLVTAGLRMTGASTVNSTEIMRKLNALGTSASAPVIDNPVNPAVQLTQSASLMAPAAAVPVSDSEKLRNAFNSQATRLSYGCSVALELFNGYLVMVSSPDGQTRVQSLEKLQSQVKGYKDRAFFTLLDLADVRSAGSIRYGDSVWLQLSVGPGDVSWEQGGVLGAKVREAPQLKALGLLDDDAIRNDVQAPAIVGYPVPVTAYLPKSRDDGDMQVDEIQSRVRNKSAKMLGKWIIRSAVCQRRKKDNFVYNNDEIYLEQDWFYLGADSEAGVAVLRQLPPAATGKDITPGEYVVERRGAWKIRLLDSSSGSAGLSLAQQQMERLLLRAKVQLKRSQRMRAGQTKVYGPNLRGGTGFTAQLRAQVAASTRQTESRYADRQESRLKRINRHLGEKARSMNVAIGFESRSRPSSGNGAVNQEREAPLYHSTSVDAIGTGGNQLSGPMESGDFKRALNQSTSSPSGSVSSCALCHSSSIGYNLCCQFRDVIGMLEQERVLAKVAATEAKVEKNSLGVNSGIRRTGRSRAGRTGRIDGGLTTRPIPMDPGRDSESDTRLTTPHNPSTTCTTPPVNNRVLDLFAKEDKAMLGLIKYKEREAYRALYDQTQPRVSLSPAAAYFRDRFKHVGLFMQMHRQQQQAQQQDGISGHFQKLHAELYSTDSRPSPDEADYDSSYDSEDDYADSEVSEEQTTPDQLPTVPPSDKDEKVELDPDRLFPTSQELEQLTPVDTKAALALYVQNRTAMAEMLDGYAELVDSQMIPTLKNSLITRNRGALVETLDFVARASEFVCARRVQVFVAKLLHAVAESESDVGDFTSFENQFEELVAEMQGAVSFIRFFLQTRASRRKNNNT